MPAARAPRLRAVDEDAKSDVAGEVQRFVVEAEGTDDGVVQRLRARAMELQVVGIPPDSDSELVAAGNVIGLIHAAGVSPSQASTATILAVDLCGTALVLEEVGNVIAQGGAGVVVASQSGHRLGALTAEQDTALVTTPADELLQFPMLQPGQVSDPLHAYQLAKRGNSLRVMAEAVRWGKWGARINTISPGIIFTPLARDELTGPRGEGYRA